MNFNMKAKITIEIEVEIFKDPDFDYDLEIAAQTLLESGRNGMNKKRELGRATIKTEYVKRRELKL